MLPIVFMLKLGCNYDIKIYLTEVLGAAASE